MLPPEARLPGVRRLIDEKSYFTVHAPRQAGKTTCFRAFTRTLAKEGRYAALLVSCEAAQAAGGDVERGISALLGAILQTARIHLEPELQPPAAIDDVPAEVRLIDLLRRWSEQCPRPVVLFLDEIDALLGDVLISVLRQLRTLYPDRPAHFPWSVALIGLRDVRDYKVVGGEHLGTSSPFNIKVESVALPGFSAAEVAQLCGQHEAETGQLFTAEAKENLFGLTQGQPWLVNAIARLAVRDLVPDRSLAIELATIEKAKEILITRRDTHLDSLLDRLREPRVRRVLEPILAGEFLGREALDDDLRYVEDLGLIRGSDALEIANPIYREIIPRALTSSLQRDLPVEAKQPLRPDGGLDWPSLMGQFRDFWREHAESFLDRAPYSEAAAQLVFMAFLQKVVNGGGRIEREYAVGSGRVDLCVSWPAPAPRGERFAIELKIWREGRADPLDKGLEQLGKYLDRLGLAEGTLVIFDLRPKKERGALAQDRVEHERRRIDIHRL